MNRASLLSHTRDMTINTRAQGSLPDDHLADDVHVYSVSVANRVTCVICGAMMSGIGVWICAGWFIPHVKTNLAHSCAGLSSCISFGATLLAFGIFFLIRTFQWHLTITNAQVEVDNGFRSHTIPFSDITGYRVAGGRGTSGIVLYRRGRSRVYLNESIFQLDDYYRRWRASIYDLNKADRLKRKACGKETAMDWFFTDNDEQNPTIGGPDAMG